MIYPENFKNKIGFDIVIDKINNFCLSTLGKNFVSKIKFSTNYSIIRIMLEQVEEFRQILLFDTHFPTDNYIDITEKLINIKIEGSYFEKETLFDLKKFLKTIENIVDFVSKRDRKKYPHLFNHIDNLNFDNNLFLVIDKIIDDKGEIRDNATEELLSIRKEIIRLTNETNKKTIQLLKFLKSESIINDDAEITIRNGRMVIPVPSPNKRKVKGFIHDESATGHTVFIEPDIVFDDNNEIRNLLNAERREIKRILVQITEQIRPNIDEINSYQIFVGLLDFLRAKAKFAIEINGVKPIINEIPIIDWKQAVHPLLFLNLKKQNKEVVSQNIELNESKRILIISGPNAGGKSVTLKTVALLQYMLQCGFLVSVNEVSEFGIFKNILIDIGDEQSIDNDLSTYSSHLLNMKTMLENSNNKTLFLIDEFGSGTEPSLGGAIAEAVLEKLISKKAYGVITTHFGNLKLIADKKIEVVNAAMLFDIENLKPLYILKIGKPGSSFTYEIANKIGLPEDVLNNAKMITGIDQINYEHKLQEIENELYSINQQKKQLKSADETLTEIINKYNLKNEELEKNKRKILTQAREEAKNIIGRTNKIIENTVSEIKNSKADKEKVKEIRKNITQFIENEIDKSEVDEIKSKNESFDTENIKLAKGDFVFLLGLDATAEIISIKEQNITVSMNGVIFRTTLDKVEKISKNEFKLIKNNSSNISVYNKIAEKSSNFKTTIDLRGKRAEESINEINKYIDDAILLRIKLIRILHGKGNGILRNVIRDNLKQNPYIQKYYDEQIEFGGSGITVVEII